MHPLNQFFHTNITIIQTIDIAHPPLSGAAAEEILHAALRQALHSPPVQIIKIIHGYGSSGKGGSLKTIARNWSFVNKKRIRLMIPGEDFSPYNPEVRSMLAECNLTASEIGAANEGMTILWIA